MGFVTSDRLRLIAANDNRRLSGRVAAGDKSAFELLTALDRATAPHLALVRHSGKLAE